MQSENKIFIYLFLIKEGVCEGKSAQDPQRYNASAPRPKVDSEQASALLENPWNLWLGSQVPSPPPTTTAKKINLPIPCVTVLQNIPQALLLDLPLYLCQIELFSHLISGGGESRERLHSVGDLRAAMAEAQRGTESATVSACPLWNGLLC